MLFRQPLERVICLGLGYVAYHFCSLLRQKGYEGSFYGTYHSKKEDTLSRKRHLGPRCSLLHTQEMVALLEQEAHHKAFPSKTLLLLSAPPTEQGDPFVCDAIHAFQQLAPSLLWIGYLSTTGVYSENNAEMITESSPTESPLPRARRRLIAEHQWQAFAKDYAVPLRIFRLAGIYGPGRNVLERLRKGKARGILKKGQIFSRIHIEDLVKTLFASVEQTLEKKQSHLYDLYNLCDDESAPATDVLAYAAGLLGMAPPAMIPYEKAQMTSMARTFYQKAHPISNVYVKKQLDVVLRYRSYREGLLALACSHAKDAPIASG